MTFAKIQFTSQLNIIFELGNHTRFSKPFLNHNSVAPPEWGSVDGADSPGGCGRPGSRTAPSHFLPRRGALAVPGSGTPPAPGMTRPPHSLHCWIINLVRQEGREEKVIAEHNTKGVAENQKLAATLNYAVTCSGSWPKVKCPQSVTLSP